MMTTETIIEVEIQRTTTSAAPSGLATRGRIKVVDNKKEGKKLTTRKKVSPLSLSGDDQKK